MVKLLKDHYLISTIKDHINIYPEIKTDPNPYFKWNKSHANI